ncbi:MAG: hypothetical protein AAF871_15845 [Pseudomonadota bacterium]
MLRTSLSALKKAASQFARRSDGSLSVEAVLMFPLLAWAYMGMYFFFDAYRQQNINLKAAYTVSDMLSREFEPIDDAYLVGANDVFDFLSYSSTPPAIRVTTFRYDADVDRYMLMDSNSTRGQPDLQQADLDEESFRSRIPIMADDDTVILLETWSNYVPPVKMGLPNVVFDNFIITSPRFTGQLCWEVCGDPGSGTNHDDGTDDGAGSSDAT